jgi:hypothetical protein
MIFRAVFWIGLVALLAPHEPDLGLGRPGAGTSHPSTLPSAVARLSRLGQDCGIGCAGGLGLEDVLHWRDNPTLAKGLAKVKAEIAADQRARAAKARQI